MIPSPERSPMRFDLDHSKLTRRVMPEARPWPICRFFNQAPRHRVAVHIPSAHFMFEDAVGSLTRQQPQPAITTEGQKVKTSALLGTDKFRHDERILHPVPRSRFAVTHPSGRRGDNAEGWGTHFCGKKKIPKKWGAPPAWQRTSFAMTEGFYTRSDDRGSR